MTHAESHELLLDLAFGELDAERAAEVEQHVQGCDECRREKEALDEARRMTSPLRVLEEPSADFDERILAAAKAQAQLTHEGNIGEVIEVAGSVKPLGLTPSSIDAHGPVAVRAERRKPRWMLRVALGGSVAAAAALALVMSTTLQNKRAVETAQKTAAYEIKIQPADELAKKGETVTESARRQPEAVPAAAPPPAPALDAKEKDKAPPPEHARRAAKKAERRDDDLALGSGGDTGPAPIPIDFGGGASSNSGAGAGQRSNELALAKPAPPPPPAPAKQMAPPMAQAPAREYAAPPPKNEPAALSAPAARPSVVASAAKAADAESPDSLEQRAENARHAGNFALAAGLYRHAADLHRSEATPNTSTAAWDLAHAVECLANIAQFDEAKKVRDELVRLYPSEDAPFSAASRALREVDQAAPASDAVKR